MKEALVVMEISEPDINKYDKSIIYEGPMSPTYRSHTENMNKISIKTADEYIYIILDDKYTTIEVWDKNGLKYSIK